MQVVAIDVMGARVMGRCVCCVGWVRRTEWAGPGREVQGVRPPPKTQLPERSLKEEHAGDQHVVINE